MRSDLVFASSKTTSNRFALCHQVFQGTRKLHKTSSMMTHTINDCFAFYAPQESDTQRVLHVATIGESLEKNNAPSKSKKAA